jgi:hypothetical protein
MRAARATGLHTRAHDFGVSYTGNHTMSDTPISLAALDGEPEDATPKATVEQLVACRSVGTSQCAPICLSSLAPYGPGGCPEAHRVWTAAAIKEERKRRPYGPLADLDGQKSNDARLCKLLALRNGEQRREVERLTMLVVAYRRLDEAAREAYPHLPGKLAADVRDALDLVKTTELSEWTKC